LLSLCLQAYTSINASQSDAEQSWHGIDDHLESEPPSQSVRHDGRAVPPETVESGSKDEPLDHRLLNARLDVSSC